MTLPAETALALYRDMLRNRKVELAIEARYHEDNMKTPVHLYIGQEAISAGICAHLGPEDPLFTTYRSHGQYLSKGGDLNRMMAELHCKETGCSSARGGSMHLIDLDAGHHGSSAIVAGAIPIATGMAFAKQMRNEPGVTVTFFGDGATEEGVFYESVNFAMLKRLPIVYVLENNGWAVCSPNSTRKVGENLYHAADPEHLWSRKVDGNDVEAVYAAAKEAVEHARSGNGPAFLECVTYRVRGHAGSGSDTRLGHRTDAEVAEWEARCPLRAFESQLVERELLHADVIAEINADLDREIEAAFAFAEESETPDAEVLMQYIYRE